MPINLIIGTRSASKGSIMNAWDRHKRNLEKDIKVMKADLKEKLERMNYDKVVIDNILASPIVAYGEAMIRKYGKEG